VHTNTAGAAHHGVRTEVYQEHTYPQVDCVGSYVRIWERLIEADGRTEAIARSVHRDLDRPGAKGEIRNDSE
jgi:hypothetical protein